MNDKPSKPRAPSGAYALGIFALVVAAIVLDWFLRFRFLDWLWGEHRAWAVAFTVFALALLPWQVIRYFMRWNGHKIPKNVPASKPAERNDTDVFW